MRHSCISLMCFELYMRIITVFQRKYLLKCLASKNIFQVSVVLMSASCKLRTCLQAAEINIWYIEGPRSSGTKKFKNTEYIGVEIIEEREFWKKHTHRFYFCLIQKQKNLLLPWEQESLLFFAIQGLVFLSLVNF